MSSPNPFNGRLNWADSIRRFPPNELGPGKVEPEALETVERVRKDVAELLPGHGQYAQAFVALWALHRDCLDIAHEISQEMKSDLGSYIHGIVHRREPDYSNAKYWFRQVGQLPFYDELQQAAAEELAQYRSQPRALAVLSPNTWQPTAFVDLCEHAIRGLGDLHLACRKLQQRELELLFRMCENQLT
jgi:hypothetical protein